MINFQGKEYFDDRLFVLYLCRGIVEFSYDENGNIVWTTIFHENAPDEHIWCVVTYRNCLGYPATGVKHFLNKERALRFIWDIEPSSPLISLNGNSPKIELPFDHEKYRLWKKENNYLEFDYKKVFTPDGSNAKEMIAQTEDQYKGVDASK